MSADYTRHGRSQLLERIHELELELEKRTATIAEQAAAETDIRRSARRTFAWDVIAYVRERVDFGQAPNADDKLADIMCHIRTMADPDW